MAYKTGWIKKIINGVSTKVFAFAHVKTVFYDYANSKTLKTKLDEIDTSISGKAASGHTHDDRYYTESEMNAKLNGKANSSHSHSNATTSAAGFMSNTDKAKLDGIASGANKTIVDSALSASSTNPVQNKVINASLAGKANSSHKHTKSQITDFPSSMPASDVYSWAKAATKPSYTASEVGAASSANPVFTGSISMGRKSNSTVGSRSTALGETTTASGSCSIAEGYYTTADGIASHAGGFKTFALGCQYAIGHYNNTTTATSSLASGTGTGTAFVIGNGYSDSSLSNAFRVDDNGTPYSKSGLNTTGCDYAEYFEWQDGNENDEDRRGYFVTLDGKYIKIADAGDWVLGIVSGFPSIIGNGDEEWRGRYVFDDFGTPVIETFEYEVDESETITNEDGEEETVTKKVKKTGTKWKENPEYDFTQPYIERSERKEWAAIGLLGVLSVRDDGTCKVNGFCKLADGGIATASDKGYRVVKRVTDNIVEVVFK